MSEEKTDLISIDFSVEEIAEITGLIDMAVKSRGLTYAPIALFLNNKFQNALNQKADASKEKKEMETS